MTELESLIVEDILGTNYLKALERDGQIDIHSQYQHEQLLLEGSPDALFEEAVPRKIMILRL